MCPTALYNHAKIGQIFKAILEKKQKLKTQHLIPFNLGLFFSIQLKQCVPLSNTLLQKDPQSCFGEKNKIQRNTCNLGLRIFQRNQLAKTMNPIVLFTHAKNWDILRDLLKNRTKIIIPTDRGQSIGSTSEVCGSNNN